MSASAVSRSIKRIEDEVGRRLLERDNRSVRLTEAGRNFQIYARRNNHWGSGSRLRKTSSKVQKGWLAKSGCFAL